MTTILADLKLIKEKKDKTEKSRLRKSTVKQVTKRKRKNKVVESSSSESETDSVELDSTDISFDGDNDENLDVSFQLEDLATEDFVMVKYVTQTYTRYFAGKIIKINDEKLEIVFLQKKPTKAGHAYNFIFPDIKDEDFVDFDQIVKKLPKAVSVGGTARAERVMKFNCDLSCYF